MCLVVELKVGSDERERLSCPLASVFRIRNALESLISF